MVAKRKTRGLVPKRHSSHESDLYPIIERWMNRHFRCFASGHNVGLAHSRADVFGVRDVGGLYNGDVETISIEVKRGTEPFATASGQAVGYSVYANRVYLADQRLGDFKPTEMEIASHLGIGLIAVHGSRCSEVLSSPFHSPMPRLSLELIHKLGLATCRLCGSVFRAGQDRNRLYSNVVRNSLKRAVTKEKGLVYWLHELNQRKARLGIARGDPGFEDKYTMEKRFLCRDCVSALFAPIFNSDR